MSYVVSATVMEGIRVDRKELVLKEKERGCKHDVPLWADNNFCGKCGKPIWVGEDEYREGFHGDDSYKQYTVVMDDDERLAIIGDVLNTGVCDGEIEEIVFGFKKFQQLRRDFPKETIRIWLIVRGG